MQIAQVLAGYTLGGADLLRRAMGKKKPEEMAKQRSRVRRRRGARAASRERVAGAHLRPDGEVRRLRLQQVALGRLCAALLPDRVPQGALPGGVHGGGAVGRHGSHRQGRDADPGVQRHGARRCCRRIQRLALRVRRRRCSAASATAWARCAAWAAAAVEALIAEREARGPYRASRTCAAGSICRRSTGACWRRCCARAASMRPGANRATLMDGLAAAMQLGEQNTRAP